MVEQKRIAQIMVGYGGPGTDVGDGYLSTAFDGYISARHLWQDCPEYIDGYNVAFFVEAVAITTTKAAPAGIGTGSTRRFAGYKLIDNGVDDQGELVLTSESVIEDFGGQVYVEFYADNSGLPYPEDVRIHFKLIKNNNEHSTYISSWGYHYFGGTVFLKIYAYKPSTNISE